MKSRRLFEAAMLAFCLSFVAPKSFAMFANSGAKWPELNQTVAPLPTTDSVQDLLEYLADYLPVTVFPPAPIADKSLNSFVVYGKYSKDSIGRYHAALLLIYERLSSTRNQKLTPLAQSIIQGHIEKVALLNTTWSSIKFDEYYGNYAHQYRAAIVDPIRIHIEELLRDLKVYADKYEPLNHIPDREVALQAIRDNPGLVAQGLEQQLLDVERRLAEVEAAARSSTQTLEEEVEAARRTAAARVEEIQQEIQGQQAELTRIQTEAQIQQGLVGAAEARLAEISRIQEKIGEKIAKLAQAVEDMFAANEFGAADLNVNRMALAPRPPAFVEKRFKAFVAAVEGQTRKNLADAMAAAFGAEARTPNIKIQMELLKPARHRTFFVTTGFRGTLRFNVNISMGLRVRDSFQHDTPVLFAHGHLSSESQEHVAAVIAKSIVQRMKAAQTTYAETETTHAAAMECLALLRDLQETAHQADSGASQLILPDEPVDPSAFEQRL